MNDVGEITILEEVDVKITTQRAVIGAKTYTLSDLISVRITREGSMVGCLLAALLSSGLLLGLYSLVSAAYNLQICLAAFIILGAALVVALLAQPNYILEIRRVSGKTDLLQSMDAEYFRRIVDAIEEAMSVRVTEDQVKAG
jgi:hypothetical protein